MISYHCQLLFAFLLLFAFAQEGGCLTCYTCKSAAAGECGDHFKSTAINATHCTDPNDVCLKQKQLINDKDKELFEVNRGCVPKNFCKLMTSKYCFLCDLDKCNSSLTLAPSVIGWFFCIFLLIR